MSKKGVMWLILVVLCAGALAGLPYLVVATRAAGDTASMCTSPEDGTSAAMNTEATLGGNSLNFVFTVNPTNAINGATLRYGVYYLGPTQQTISDYDAPNQVRVISTSLDNTPATMLVGEGVAGTQIALPSGISHSVTATWDIPANAPKGVYVVLPALTDGAGQGVNLTGVTNATVTMTTGSDPGIIATKELSPQVRTGADGQPTGDANFMTLLHNANVHDHSASLTWNTYSGAIGTSQKSTESFSAQVTIAAGQSSPESFPVQSDAYETQSVVELTVAEDGAMPYKLRQSFEGSSPSFFEVPVRRVSSFGIGGLTLHKVSFCVLPHTISSSMVVLDTFQGKSHSESLTNAVQKVSYWQWSAGSTADTDFAVTVSDTTRTYQTRTSPFCGADKLLCGRTL